MHKERKEFKEDLELVELTFIVLVKLLSCYRWSLVVEVFLDNDPIELME